MRNLLLLVILSLSCATGYSQSKNIDGIIGYQNQHYNTIELGIALSERDQFETYKNFHVCAEYLFRSSEPCLIGLKTGIDFSNAIFIFSGQAAYYFNKDDKALLLRPEAGFTLFGFADITFGYNLFLVKENVDIGHNVLSIRIKMPMIMLY